MCVCRETPTYFRLTAINVIIAMMCDSEWTFIALGNLVGKCRPDVKLEHNSDAPFLEILSTCPSCPALKMIHLAMMPCSRHDETAVPFPVGRELSSHLMITLLLHTELIIDLPPDETKCEREEVRVGMRWPRH